MSASTPMMRQYQAIKKQYPEGFLFFRLGDFYELFGSDAEQVSRLLGLTLTSRNRNKENAVPLCGVPHHSASNYIARLIKQGHKVVICDQVEDPKTAKGIVKREVVRVVTPGTVWETELLDEKSNNFLVSLQPLDGQLGLAALDISTGEFRVTQFPLNEPERHKTLEDEIARLQPGEILLPESVKPWAAEVFSAENINTAPQNLVWLDDWVFNHDQAYGLLLRELQAASLKGFGCEDLPLAVRAAGAVLHYVKETQKSGVDHINTIKTYHLQNYMLIDAATRRNLELTNNIQDNSKKGSLLHLLDETVTAMGGRCLKHWLLHPLLDLARLEARQTAVEELLSSSILRHSLRQNLQRVYDLERLLGRVAMGKASPRDMVSLKVSLQQIPAIRETLTACRSELLRKLIAQCQTLPDLVELLDTALTEDPPLSLKDGGVILCGFDPRLDELRELSSRGKDWIARLENTERRRTGVNSLKIRYNKVFGYYIELTKSNLAAVPENYLRKQTLANAERFITPELKEYEEKVLGAEEKILALEEDLFLGLRRRVAEYIPQMQMTAQALARLDTLAALAEAAAKNNYVKPRLHLGPELKINEGRHPVVESVLAERRFVPNDTLLDNKKNRLLIITGPNMAGKSTYLRQVAIIALLAQTGGFVPAQSAFIGLVDRIFSRVGAADNLLRGESTFMVEMNETANILNNATSRSLIILDEIGRGTSTFDGLSIAWAVAEYINNQNTLGAKTLFATHYHELTDLALSQEGVKNYNIAVREWNEEIIFLYKIIAGGCDRSYGIQVAKLAGLPGAVIERAKEVLKNLEEKELDANGAPALSHSQTSPVKPPRQPSLFTPQAPEQPLLREIKALDISNLTPLAALNKLATWQESLKKKP